MNFNEYTKATFTPKFVELYEKRWKEKKKSQADFAKSINELYAKYDIRDRWGEDIRICTPQQVSKWLHGTFPDKDNIRCISEVLDVDPEYFTFTMSFEKAFHDPEYVNEEDQHFYEDMKDIGIERSFFDFLTGKELFSIKFPFHPRDLDTPFPPEYLDSGIRSKRRFEYREGKFRHCVTMSLNDLQFIKDIQDEVERTIARMFWNKFEEYRQEQIEDWIKLESKLDELPIEILNNIYTQNPDWFIRTHIHLKDQLISDISALGDLIWNYRVENKIPIPEKDFASAHYDVLPEVDEMNKLLHEDREELERQALESERRLNEESNKAYLKRVKDQNKAILNGTARKIERRK